MAALFALKYPARIRKLILLAPALCFREYRLPDSEPVDMPVIIYHGDKDDVVPLGPVRKIADRVFSNLAFHGVDDDHLLHKTFRRIDWDNLLST
jgi:predicted esterase